MSENQGTLALIGTHLVLSVKPLKDAVSSPDQFKAFMYRLGWSVTALPPAYSNLATVIDQAVQALEAIADDPTIEEAKALIEKAKAVYDAIQAIHEAPPGVDAGTFLAEIGQRLFELLLTDYLANALPASYNFLRMFQVIEYQNVPGSAGRQAHIRTKFNWDRIPKIISDPLSLPKNLYGWGTPDLKMSLIVEHLAQLLTSLKFPVTLSADVLSLGKAYSGIAGELDEEFPVLKVPFYYIDIASKSYEASLTVLPVPASNGKMPGIVLQPQIPAEFPFTFHLADNIDMRIRAGSNIASLFGIVVRPEEVTVKYPFQNGQSLPSAGFGIGFDFKPATPAILFGKRGDTRLQLQNSSVSFGINYANTALEAILKAELKGLALVISAGQGDNFIQKMLGGGELQIGASMDLEWSSTHGVKFSGGTGFEVATHPHLSLGPVTIEDVLIRLFAQATPEPQVKLESGISFRTTLGPLVAVVQNIGLAVSLNFREGNAGPFDLQLGFKPPNGVGLSLDAGIVKGGGYILFDPDKGQYAGALELSIQNTIQVAAICVITTRMPDGSDGFSLLIVISATFTPGIVLGMGFFLSGLGGMLGIHRTINVDALREGVRTNAIDHILFPEDVVNNIIPLINQITTIFPPKKDQFIIGLMARITWGVPALITIDFGIAVEFASPTRFAILGVLKIVLPTEEAALMQFQVNFIGIIDFEKGMLSFDASLFNSRILTFTLEGDMALRLAWGETKGFLMSVGGFHPTFKPPAELRVPTLRRLTVNILTGNPRLVLTCYFAITSNTVQFGARVDLLFRLSEFKVVGYLYFDVLFQFSPFRFIANIGAGLEVKMGNTTILSITLDFELSGPTPWHAKGIASFSILFFTIKVRFDAEWGDKQSIEEPAIAVLPKALEAFNLDANWTTELPVNRTALVSLREIPPQSGQIVLQPFGSFRVSQTVVPLVQQLEKFGNNKPADIRKIEVKEVKIGNLPVNGNYVTDAFAPAMFKKMEDKDKLSAPSYEQMKSGIKITETDQILVNARANRKVEYEVKISDFDPTPKQQPLDIDMLLLRRMTKGGEIGKNSISKEYAFNKIKQKEATVSVADESFVLVNKANMNKVDVEAFNTGSFTEASDVLQNYLQKHPEAKGKIKVVPAYHLELV